MTISLIPVTGSYGALVRLSKRDPQAADMLAWFALNDALEEQIEAVRPELTAEVLKRMADLNGRARTALLRSHVGKALEGQEVDDLGTARDLAVVDAFVEKGVGHLIGEVLQSFNRKHPRDEHGRFERVNVRPSSRAVAGPARDSEIVTRTQLEANKWIQGKVATAESSAILYYQNQDDTGKPTGTIYASATTVGDAAKHAKELIDSGMVPHQLAISRRNTMNASPQVLAAVDLTRLATGANEAEARRMTSGLFEGDKVKSFGQGVQQNWYGPTQGTDRQAYRRVGMVGQAVSAAAVPGTPGAMVGAMAQLAGALGPEAEKVLGPGIRRAAYRYRGTERKPADNIRRTLAMANGVSAKLNSNSSEVFESAEAKVHSESSARGQRDPGITVAKPYLAGNIPGDQRDLLIRGDAVVAELLGASGGVPAIPDPEITAISLASGEMPPSEGVMIDARGQLVTQAVGYNGDHYLPFDLKNLNALFGGQYVRTRASGGLTREDIYTGLLTGARQMQVVSNSGVFTLEFDPDLRGGRRYNDKAKRMIERYESMLSAIENKQNDLFISDISPEAKADIRAKVAPAARDQAHFDSLYNDKLREARLQASYTEAEQDELEEAADRYARQQYAQEAEGYQVSGQGMPSSQQRQEILEDHRKDYKANKAPVVRRLKLDGEGYGRALKALKAEFPYYIRTATYQPLQEWLKGHGLDLPLPFRTGGTDVGYVEPGQTNTAAAMKTGFRTARKMPGRAAAQAREETPEAAGTGERRTLTSTPGQQAPSAPAAPGAETFSIDKERKIGGKLHEELSFPLGRLMEVANADVPEIGALKPSFSTEEAMSYPAEEYANWQAIALKKKHGDAHFAEMATDWFLNEATPEQRDKMLEAFEDYEPKIANGRWKALAGKDPEFRRHYENVVDMLGWLDPYDPKPPEGIPPHLVKPGKKNAKPQKFPDVVVPAVDASPEVFKQQRAQLALGSRELPSLSQDFSEMAQETPDDRADYVRDKVKAATAALSSGKADEAAAAETAALQAQVAWSFLVTEEANANLRKIINPKAPEQGVGKSSGPHLHLRLSKRAPDPDPFLLQLREELLDLERLISGG